MKKKIEVEIEYFGDYCSEENNDKYCKMIGDTATPADAYCVVFEELLYCDIENYECIRCDKCKEYFKEK
jgi:hypothetical protein